MPNIRTCVTEIYTALGICSREHGPISVEAMPHVLKNVSTEIWQSIRDAAANDELARLAAAAWDNGRVFLHDPEVLAGVPPFLVEWKGQHKLPGYEYLPADVRVNHVHLVSCKYGSNILLNTSPAHLFDRALSSRYGHGSVDWYYEVAAGPYNELLRAVTAELGLGSFPGDVALLNEEQRIHLKTDLKRAWPGRLSEVYKQLAGSVAEASCKRWRAHLGSRVAREEMLWRLLRLSDAPYYILGTDTKGAQVRVRVSTPWDWRQQFRLKSFEVFAADAGQPVVTWTGIAEEITSGRLLRVDGHVEIRWSHGRFNGSPEAKVYLDTAHGNVPGYFALGTQEEAQR